MHRAFRAILLLPPVCLLALLVLLPGRGEADDLLAVTEEWPPFNHTVDGEVDGCATRVVRAVLERAGLQAHFESHPWARSYLLARTHPNVLIYSIARSEEREGLFHWIGALGERRMFLYRLAGRDDVRVERLEDLERHTVGVVREDIVHQFFREGGHMETGRWQIAASFEQNLQMLLLGRVDLVAGTDSMVVRFLRSEGLDLPRVRRVIELPLDTRYYLAASRGTDAELVDRLRGSLEELRDAGVVERLNRECFRPWRLPEGGVEANAPQDPLGGGAP